MAQRRLECPLPQSQQDWQQGSFRAGGFRGTVHLRMRIRVVTSLWSLYKQEEHFPDLGAFVGQQDSGQH